MVLEGRWLDYLIDEMRQHFGDPRDQVIGKPTMARNLARTVTRQTSALYKSEPTISNEDAAAAETLTDIVRPSMLWQMGKRHQMRTMFINDGLMAVDTVEREGQTVLTYESVPMDMVYIEKSATDPMRMGRLVHAVARTFEKDGKRVCMWTLDDWNIHDPENPYYRIILPGKDEDIDITSEVIEGAPEGGYQGSDFAWRWSQGERKGLPFIPYVLYHREASGKLLDPWDNIEALEATKTVAVLWSFWVHCVKDASFAQRWTVNARLRGGSVTGGEGYSNATYVPADPTSVMQFATDAMESAQMGQWLAGVDPERLEVAVASFERSTAGLFGLSSGSWSQGGSAESGYALEVKNEAVREISREVAPNFRVGDEELMQKSAAVCNISGITSGLAEEGYRVEYARLPMSAEERRAAKERMDTLNAADLGGRKPSPQWVLQQVQGVDNAGATDIMKQWEADWNEIGGEPSAAPDADPTETPEDTEQRLAAEMGGESGADPRLEDAAAKEVALNGAQISSAVTIVQEVAQGRLPREVGINMLESFLGLSKQQAQRVMGTVGRGFTIKEPK